MALSHRRRRGSRRASHGERDLRIDVFANSRPTIVMRITHVPTGLVVVAEGVPSPCNWKHFLTGLLANMQEVTFNRAGWPELYPVLWSIRGGVLNRPTEAKYEQLPTGATWADVSSPSTTGRRVATDRAFY
jgi:hypothetical protein